MESLQTTFEPTFDKVSEKENFPAAEEKHLNYWKEIDAFKKQLKLTENDPPYSFYDGPPFATGLPHYGNLLAGTVKDICTRYASQNGFHVARRFGWDCHGLPIEYEIDKKLQIKGHEDYEKIGISTYNNNCREIIMRYAKEWETIVGRFGRWIDFEDDYKTMDWWYMESVWWVFKQIFDSNLVFKSSRIMPYSTACGTVLSNFEANSNYKDVSDPSLIITFPLLSQQNVSLLGWTTTPWTLPSNLAVAVNPEFNYHKIKMPDTGEFYIVGEPHLKEVCKLLKLEEPDIVETFKGKELEGLEYEPLFDYFMDLAKDGCFRVLMGEYVTADAGTGLVHCAPGFGEEDFTICVKNKIIHPGNPPCPVDSNGRFTTPVLDYKGMHIKDTDPLIKEELKSRGRLIFSGSIVHSYPYCWRSETPLIYRAVQAWFIKVPAIKEELMEVNMKARWVPSSVQERRFHNWLQDARDWCFSRNRYWGNPIPLWVSDDGEEVVCVGSIEELKQLTGAQEITDLHRDYVDHLTIPSKMGKGDLHRISEVFDCWFESGSMPFAQFHYPFSTSKDEFMKKFPADFIAEGIDQTRGWYYTLNVISTIVTHQNPFKNLIVHGLVLAQDGKKMSKRLHNYPDPMHIANKYGVDAVRMYMISSPVVRGENLKFNEKGINAIVRDVFLPWYNAYRFLIQNITRWELQTKKQFEFDSNIKSTLNAESNTMDKWIIAANQNLIRFVRKEMENYRLYTIIPKLLKFLEDLTNWYVRLNRNRIKGMTDEEDWRYCINVLFDVLLSTTTLMAPYTPFITELIYQNLRKGIPKESDLNKESIHFVRIPECNEGLIDEKIEEKVERMQRVIELGRVIRDRGKTPLKFPLQKVMVVNKNKEYLEDVRSVEYYIKEELNVFELELLEDEKQYLFYTAAPEFKILADRLAGKFDNKMKAAIPKLTEEQIFEYLREGKVQIGEEVVLENELKIGKKFMDKYTKNKKCGCASHLEVGVMCDLEKTEKLLELGVAREFANKIQKQRKECGVNIEDPVEIFYQTLPDSPYLDHVVDTHFEYVSKIVKVPFLQMKQKPDYYVQVGHDEFQHKKEKITFAICSTSLAFKQQSLEEKCKDFENQSEFVENVKKVMLAYDFPTLKKTVSNNNGTFEMKLNGKELTLNYEQDFFYGVNEFLKHLD